MKHTLHSICRLFLCIAALTTLTFQSKASHIVGLDLHYTWLTGDQYKVTLIAYGDCGPSSSAAFSTLPGSTPYICVYDGASYVTTIVLNHDSTLNPYNGKEITPVCPADTNSTQCHSSSSSIPGIKQFGYSKVYTVPHHSAHWRFVYYGGMGGGSGAGRAAAITNISGGTITSLVDTLNNSVHNNSNPVLTIVPTPFFCLNNNDTYSPGGVDADGDSLYYDLVAGANGGGSSTCTAAGFVSYTGGHSAAAPLSTSAGSFSFDHNSGQISFYPNVTQRSLVVYNIEEYRNDTLIGTSQREMTFLVLTCSNTPPSGGFVSDSGSGTLDDATHYHICANTDSVFAININGTESDTANHITIRNTGLPPGCSFSVANDSTNHPIATLRWSSYVTPGTYVVYIIIQDNNCPIQGNQTFAVNISILPIPNIAYTIITPASCSGDAIVSVTPGGLGAPWRVTLNDAAGTILRNDSGLTTTYLDTLAPGNDTFKIYSNLSNFCYSKVAIAIDTVAFPVPVLTHTQPTYCGANDGTMHLSGMNRAELDTIKFNINGLPQAQISVLTSTTGTVDISTLCPGHYDNFTVNFGHCHTTPPPAFDLVAPGMSIYYKDSTNPSQCGLSDGTITISGLHPGQLDTVSYDFNGVPHTPFVAVVYPDSTITITGLAAGTYTNILAYTTGSCPGTGVECVSNSVGPVTLVQPVLSCYFDTFVHLGCVADTIQFDNHSSPTGMLNYRWYFGDGMTDTMRNPFHVYLTPTATTYIAKLYISNGHCIDSAYKNIAIPEKVHSIFSTAPDTICQGSTVNFSNSSTGINNGYMWDFGDGSSMHFVNASHVYPFTGNYKVTLTASDHINCLDSMIQYVQVDSNTELSLNTTDTVLCKGGSVTFNGSFTDIGLTNILWSFGDGISFQNQNPIQHAYEITGAITVDLTVTYRMCPQKHISKELRIYPYPTIYLGSDTSICAGGQPMLLSDNINYNNPVASWLWNTGATTSAITVKKEGEYIATVNVNGCTATDTIYITNDCYADMPSIFSPNGDGINDYFFPRQELTKGLTEFSLNIYNRWGQQIYQTNTLDGRGWDGNFNGVAQPQGVYIYVISAKFKDGQILNKQGNITLVR